MNLPPIVGHWGRPAPAPAAVPTLAWDWPRQVPPIDAMAVIDAHAIRMLDIAPGDTRLEWQTLQLRRLLRFAREASPLWRDALPADALQADAADLARLPILDRATFRSRIESGGRLATPPWHGQPMHGATSGSTGMPVRFHTTELAQRLNRSQYWADHARQGRDMFRPWAVVGGHVPAHPGATHQVLPAQPWRGEGQGLLRNTESTPLADTADWVSGMAPAYLFASPTLFSGLLDRWETASRRPQGLVQVGTFGATVDPSLRERARRLLGAGIRDRYSCEEVGPLAMQCPHDETRHHVAVAHVLLEVVDDHGAPCAPGVPGRVLVTGLHQWANPVIRYDIGDVAALRPHCSCGATVPSLSNLLGRKRGLVRTAAGEQRFVRITGKDWLDAAPIREQRLVQQDLHSIRVELVADRPLETAERAALLAMLARRIDPSLRYDIVELEAIDWPPGRKRQDFVGLD